MNLPNDERIRALIAQIETEKIPIECQRSSTS